MAVNFKECSNNNYGCDVYYCKKHFEKLTAIEAGTYHLNEGWLCSLCNPWK